MAYAIRYTLAEIAKIVGGRVHGDPSIVITGVASLEDAAAGDISFVTKDRMSRAKECRASAILTPELTPDIVLPQIVVDEPYAAFIPLLRIIESEHQALPKGIHPSAIIEDGAEVCEGAAIGPCAVIERNARVGPGSIVMAGSYIGPDSSLGRDCLVYANVTIQRRVSIGDRAIIHPGAVIGGDGFGFRRSANGFVKVPQVGRVEIGDDVEIGCNATIDRATMGTTIIGNGVKIDNHCHIAHNCRIGHNSLLVAYARIAGSTTIGKNVILAEDVGVTDNVTVGDGATVAATAKVSKDVPPGVVVWGNPAQDIRKEKRERVAMRRLPDMIEQIKEMKSRLDRLEEDIREKR